MKNFHHARAFLSALTAVLAGVMTPAHALPPSTSEYVTDGQSVYNNDDTTDTFQLIKIVSCFIKNTKPELRTGQGKYVAWVGQSTCEDTYSSSDSNEKRFNKATIESGADSRGHLIVRMWLQALSDHTVNNVTTYTYDPIYVHVDIAQGVNVAPPFGYWTINFCKPTGGSLTATTCDEMGYGQVTPSNLKVYHKGTWDDGTINTRQGSISFDVTNGEIQTGRGAISIYEDRTHSSYGGPDREVNARFAFKPGYYRSKLSGITNEICYDRIAEHGYENVWQTWLYNNDANVTSGTGAYGQRLNMNGGMSIKKSTTDNENRGWASYWGIWFPDGVERPASGSTVYADVSGQSNKPYTYTKTTGQLNKNVITNGTLAGIAGIPLTVRLPKNIAVANSTDSSTIANARVTWNASSSSFEVSDFNGNPSLGGKSLTFSELIDGYALGNGWNNYRSGSIGMNQEGTNNWYQITLGDGSGTVTTDNTKTAGCGWNINHTSWDCYLIPRSSDPNSNNPARFTQRMQTRVLPGSADATIVQNMGDLVCTGSCIQNSGSGTWGSVRITDTIVYNYNATSGVMSVVSKGGDTSASVTGAVQKPAINGNYMDTEPLVASTDTTNLNLAKCYGDTTYCGWQIKENPRSGTFTFYSFSVSPDQRWGDTEFLSNSSGVLVFDVPLNLNYTVNQSNSTANGKTMNLQYQGNANLNMPGHCVTRSTGVTVDCSGSWSDKFYVNDFTVPPWQGTLNDFQTAGTLNPTKTNQATLVKLESSNQSYLAKWMSKGVMFRTIAGGTSNITQCGDLAVPAPAAIVLPGLPDWNNPANPSSSNYIGTWQEPTATPVVTDGVFVTQ